MPQQCFNFAAAHRKLGKEEIVQTEELHGSANVPVLWIKKRQCKSKSLMAVVASLSSDKTVFNIENRNNFRLRCSKKVKYEEWRIIWARQELNRYKDKYVKLKSVHCMLLLSR